MKKISKFCTIKEKMIFHKKAEMQKEVVSKVNCNCMGESDKY